MTARANTRTGPDPVSAGTLAAVQRLNAAVNAGDVAALAACLHPNCVFESTGPAPDGLRFDGAGTVTAVLARLFTTARERRFDVEEVLVCGERATARWTHHWVDQDGNPGHVRGVDVFRVVDGLVAEKLSYVKG